MQFLRFCVNSIIPQLCKLYKGDYNVLIENKLKSSSKNKAEYAIQKDTGLPEEFLKICGTTAV